MQQTQDYLINRVVGSERNEARKMWYRVRWYGYDRDWETIEIIEHLPRSAVLCHHWLAGAAPPPTLCKAQMEKAAFVDN